MSREKGSSRADGDDLARRRVHNGVYESWNRRVSECRGLKCARVLPESMKMESAAIVAR